MNQKINYCKDCSNCIYLYDCPYTKILHSYCPHKIKGDPVNFREKEIYKNEIKQAKKILTKINNRYKKQQHFTDTEIDGLIESIFDQTKQILEYRNGRHA